MISERKEEQVFVDCVREENKAPDLLPSNELKENNKTDSQFVIQEEMKKHSKSIADDAVNDIYFSGINIVGERAD